jgi:hypothetical protein
MSVCLEVLHARVQNLSSFKFNEVSLIQANYYSYIQFPYTTYTEPINCSEISSASSQGPIPQLDSNYYYL